MFARQAIAPARPRLAQAPPVVGPARGRRRGARSGRRTRLAAAAATVVLGTASLAGCSFLDASDTRAQPATATTGATGTVTTTFSADPNAQPPVITTTGGKISGVRETDVDRYHGIPFAAPPVGNLRWAAPQSPSPWQGIRDGSRGGLSCTQTGLLSGLSGEDCLYLAVTRPAGAPTNAKLPVIFWIHGGAFVGGAGETVDPAALAAGGAIVVSTNYRLGALGYLVLPSLMQENQDAGNYATQDLIAALRWVQNNAAAFGGDPKNVTIMGESAGSMNVCTLLAAPAANGLFQQAIMESAPCSWKLPTLANAAQTGTALANRLGCVDQATAALCLRSRSASEIMAAAATDGEIFDEFPYSPAVGGKTLPLTPSQALWNGKLADVPMLMGTIRDEGRPFTIHWASAGPVTDFGVDSIVRSRFPDRADRVLAAYPPGKMPARERLSKIITDSMFTCQTTSFAQLAAGLSQASIYLYEFDVPDSAPTSAEFGSGATHGWEIDYLFPSAQTTADKLTTPAKKALSKAMIGYWTRFAATGVPGTNDAGGTAVTWPKFDVKNVRSGNDRLLLTPEKIAPVSGTWAAHHCDVWS